MRVLVVDDEPAVQKAVEVRFATRATRCAWPRTARRPWHHPPVTVSDCVTGFDAGADDYLVKPFALERLARLRALLRRTGGPGEDRQREFAGLHLDPATREVRRDGRPIELTRAEFLLLELFLRNPRREP